MKLIEALEILRKPPAKPTGRLVVGLVCGFNPLHLQSLLAAQLQLALPDQKIEIQGGLYGDFWGNLDRMEKAGVDECVVVLEWADLDPRLGIRALGGWAPNLFANIQETVKARLTLLQDSIQRTASQFPVTLSFPTLPLPPVSFAPGWQASSFDLELRSHVSSAAAQIINLPGVRIASQQRLDRLSPCYNRLDVRSDVNTGFPYKLPHAAVLADVFAQLIQNRIPKKGIITDLDDTLWKGILGEVGPDGVAWDLDHRAHLHALYQQLLQALSAIGVLVAAASKNQEYLVEEAFRRKDMLLQETAVFPKEIHWGPKSESVGRILKAWNIGPEAVVFVDDNPAELAEVEAKYPAIACLQFQPQDPDSIYELLEKLRDLFGKSAVLEEDVIRQDSIRRSKDLLAQEVPVAGLPSSFLEQAQARISLSFRKDALDARILELTNKTNQFNLNGRRYTDAAWRNYLRDPHSFLMAASYEDKYGPLGKIAVLAGRQDPDGLRVEVWVMSCRAFGRRIEHRCLQELFFRFAAESIHFDFVATERNQPMQQFLTEILGKPPTADTQLTREQFKDTRLETSFQSVVDLTNE